MKNENKIDIDYQNLLNDFKFPLVYNYPTKFKLGSIKSSVRFIPSEFYQTTESLAILPTKPISKIIYG